MDVMKVSDCCGSSLMSMSRSKASMSSSSAFSLWLCSSSGDSAPSVFCMYVLMCLSIFDLNHALDLRRSSSVCLVDQQPSFLQTKHRFIDGLSRRWS